MIKKNSKPKIIISCVLACLLLAFTLINIKLYYGKTSLHIWYIVISIFSCLVIAAVGSIKCDFGKKGNHTAGIIVYIISIFNAMNIAAVFSYGLTQSVYLYMVNVAFYFAFAAAALLISGRMQVSALTALIVSYIFNVISFIIYSFRGQPLTPTDIYGFKTAMNVASMYKFQLKYQMITATIMAIAQIMLTCKFPLKFTFKYRPVILRAIGAVGTAVSLTVIATVDIAQYDVSVFDQFQANVSFGSAFSFYVNTTKMGLKKSDTYDSAKLNAELDSYSGENNGEVTEQSPNIIVVMNESFSDLAVLGDFTTNEDYMPFFHSLKGSENTITGNLLVSPVGGYTCNTEFEFLTGMNTGLLQSNALPYVQMIFDTVPYSMVSHMKDLGYHTMAFHPYYANGWNRNNVYNFMGFDEFVSLKNMDKYNEKPLRMRSYISDQGDYDTITNYLSSKEDQSKRDFIMNVTMQNHGGYDYEDFKQLIYIDGSNGKYPLTEQYLSLIKHSDDALEQFLGTLKAYDQPTVIVFFGDHQPNVDENFLVDMFGTSTDNVDSETLTKRYTVPFLIWANYDIEEKEDILTSPSFLSGKVMEAAGLPKSRVQMYLDTLQNDVTQMNPYGYYDKESVWHPHSDYDFSEYYDLEYAILKNEDLDYDFKFNVNQSVFK